MKMRNLISTFVVVSLMLTGFVGANQIRQLQADLDAANETIFNSQVMISEESVALGDTGAQQQANIPESAIALSAPVAQNPSVAQSPSAQQSTPTQQIIQVTQKWDAAYLATFNGKNGKPTYIAVFGTVYDVTKDPNWTNGKHKGITAGADVTNAFEGSPHAKALLKTLPVVAKMGDVVKGLAVTAAPTQLPAAKVSAVLPAAKVTAVAPVGIVKSQQTVATLNPTTVAQKWTVNYLANFNGKNGKQAFIAVSGVIYDVSANRSWVNGSHKGVTAGADVTNAFANSPHAKSLLAQLPVVAKMGDDIKGLSGTTVSVPKNTIASIASSSANTGSMARDDDDHEDDDDDHDDDSDEGDDD